MRDLTICGERMNNLDFKEDNMRNNWKLGKNRKRIKEYMKDNTKIFERIEELTEEIENSN